MPSDLDPRLVKAMTIEETGVGTIDGSYGQNGKSATPNQSLYAGVRMLYTKGLRTSTIKNKKGTVIGYKVTWRGSDWKKAIQNYNGGGNPNYLQDILKLLSNTLEPNSKNYTK